MRLVSRLAIMLMMIATLGGCASNRRWGPCALAGGLIGGALGAFGGGYGVHEYEPDPTREEIFGGAGAGLATGMLIGTMLGHYICDPEDDSSANSRGR
jgi:hypothetical protein